MKELKQLMIRLLANLNNKQLIIYYIMKLSRIILSSFALLLGSGTMIAQSTPDTLRLSREECISIALQESPTIRVADLEVKKTDYSKKEVLANLFPNIDFSGAYQRAIELQTINMDFGGKPQKLKMGSENTWMYGFQASVPLVNVALWKSISVSDTQILASLESARSSRLNLVDNINKAYYAYQLAIASQKVIKRNYDVAKENHDIYKKQFEQGTASEYDVLRSGVQITNIEPELLQADIAIRQCQLQLKVLMGIDSNTVVVPSNTINQMQQDMFGATATLNTVIDNNTSLRTLDIQKKMLEQNLQIKKAAWIPTLAASYNLNWNALSNGNPLKNQEFNPYSTVALSLQIPIFAGGKRYYGMKQAEVQLKEIDYQREDLVNALNMQVELALDNINKQVKQIASAEAGMKQAAKAHEIMQKSFEIGAASYLNLRDSEVAYTQAQLAHLQTIYNYLVSTSDLDTLLGKETFNFTSNPKEAQTK